MTANVPEFTVQSSHSSEACISLVVHLSIALPKGQDNLLAATVDAARQALGQGKFNDGADAAAAALDALLPELEGKRQDVLRRLAEHAEGLLCELAAAEHAIERARPGAKRQEFIGRVAAAVKAMG